MKDLIFSIDAETNGLYGEAFAIGITIFTRSGSFVHLWDGTCPLPGDDIMDPWVKENVAPYYADKKPNCTDYTDLLEQFAQFYRIYQMTGNIDVVCHMGVPVESKLFIDMKEKGFIGENDGPYPLIDVSAFPEIGTSVDDYVERFHLIDPETSPVKAQTHTAVYDAYVTAVAYLHLMEIYDPK